MPSVDSPAATTPVVHLEAIRRSYNIGMPSEIEILHGIDLDLHRGEFVALMGTSGSGKSTLLNIIGLLDRPTAGRVFINGIDTGSLDDAAITRLRGHAIGFVFQEHHLISAFTALENVMMPMIVDRNGGSDAIRARATILLAKMGLAQVGDNMSSNMSGGEQQRVAIARALAMRANLILADEPTGNLDSQSADNVFDFMRQVNKDEGTSFLIVTHNLDLARKCDRIITMADGTLVPA
ncbi:MAG: ABC transporter ATP-binding protein [Beijerinckiaceae bacterium]|jgi:lipoprotein-releasing system ATP-binding protein|nr:ABC transporter ATP-binding protein [Beijerinckiaceae bacterium]